MNTEILRHLVGFYIRSSASIVHRNRKHICVQKSDCASNAQGRAIVLYRNIVPEISHQFLKRSKIIEIVNIAVVPLRVGYPINTVFALSRFTILLSFRHAPLVGYTLRMKTSLKYAHMSREHVQLHICSCVRVHFYRLFDVFSFHCYTLSMFIEAKIQSAYLCGARYSPRLCSIARP